MNDTKSDRNGGIVFIRTDHHHSRIIIREKKISRYNFDYSTCNIIGAVNSDVV